MEFRAKVPEYVGIADYKAYMGDCQSLFDP